ncbi:MAG TPA: amidohydrolase family protein [Pyrinomonadaceae bacterium]|nr:amidohydrolase family protein [Pyrinomonadaceae bacterium]
MKRHIIKRALFLLALVLLLPYLRSPLTESNAQTSLPPQKTYQFTNGQWFNGTDFRRRTFYSAGGVLTRKKPAKIDEAVDLKNGYVIPPLVEAHNHWLEPQSIDEYIQNYLRDGVFYVKDEGNLPYLVSQFRDKLNRPTSVDFISALQGFTGSGGHPLEIIRQFKDFGVLPKEWTERDFDGKAVMIIDDAKDIPSRWSMLLEGKPDFVKAFLLYSEQHGLNKDDPKKSGLDPKLLPEIVQRAHQAGLEISVHISTATDFHNALVAGADEITHLPFIDFDKKLGNEHFLIREADAKLAAKRGVRVITTLGWLKADLGEDPQRAEEARTQVVIPNLRLLKRHGVKLLVGSDQFRQTSLPEILLISSLKVFTNLELLKMSSETTPQAIFPKRKIGFLRDSYEASFLVLDGNPMTDFEQIKNIRLRFKQGYFINLPK